MPSCEMKEFVMFMESHVHHIASTSRKAYSKQIYFPALWYSKSSCGKAFESVLRVYGTASVSFFSSPISISSPFVSATFLCIRRCLQQVIQFLSFLRKGRFCIHSVCRLQCRLILKDIIGAPLRGALGIVQCGRRNEATLRQVRWRRNFHNSSQLDMGETVFQYMGFKKKPNINNFC